MRISSIIVKFSPIFWTWLCLRESKRIRVFWHSIMSSTRENCFSIFRYLFGTLSQNTHIHHGLQLSHQHKGMYHVSGDNSSWQSFFSQNMKIGKQNYRGEKKFVIFPEDNHSKIQCCCCCCCSWFFKSSIRKSTKAEVNISNRLKSNTQGYGLNEVGMHKHWRAKDTILSTSTWESVSLSSIELTCK